MGPIPKKAARRNSTKPNLTIAIPEGGALAKPPLESGKYLKATKDWWNAFWASEVAGLISPEELPSVYRLAYFLDQHDRLKNIIRREGVTVGARVHPATKLIASYEGIIAKLESELGLTPLARAKLLGEGGRTAKTLKDLRADAIDMPKAIDPPDPRLKMLT